MCSIFHERFYERRKIFAELHFSFFFMRDHRPRRELNLLPLGYLPLEFKFNMSQLLYLSVGIILTPSKFDIFDTGEKVFAKTVYILFISSSLSHPPAGSTQSRLKVGDFMVIQNPRRVNDSFSM